MDRILSNHFSYYPSSELTKQEKHTCMQHDYEMMQENCRLIDKILEDYKILLTMLTKLYEHHELEPEFDIKLLDDCVMPGRKTCVFSEISKYLSFHRIMTKKVVEIRSYIQYAPSDKEIVVVPSSSSGSRASSVSSDASLDNVAQLSQLSEIPSVSVSVERDSKQKTANGSGEQAVASSSSSLLSVNSSPSQQGVGTGVATGVAGAGGLGLPGDESPFDDDCIILIISGILTKNPLRTVSSQTKMTCQMKLSIFLSIASHYISEFVNYKPSILFANIEYTYASMINILYTVSFILECAPRQFDSFVHILKFIAHEAFDDQEQPLEDVARLPESEIPSSDELIESLKKEFTLYPELPAIWLYTLVQTFKISCKNVGYDPLETFETSIKIFQEDTDAKGKPAKSEEDDIGKTLNNIKDFMIFFCDDNIVLNDVSIIDIAVMCGLLYWNEVFECLNLFFSIPPKIQQKLFNPKGGDESSVMSGVSAATRSEGTGAVTILSEQIIILLYRYYLDGKVLEELFFDYPIKDILDIRTLRVINNGWTMYDEDNDKELSKINRLKQIVREKIQVSEVEKKGGSSKRWRYNNNNNITHRKKQINKLNIVKTKRNQINPTSVNRKITIKRPHSIYSSHTHTIRKR